MWTYDTLYSYLSLAEKLVVIVAAASTAIAACLGLSVWKRQTVGRLKQQAALRLLHQAYTLGDKLTALRTPRIPFETEVQLRMVGMAVSQEVASEAIRDAELKRAMKTIESFQRFSQRLQRMRTLLGSDHIRESSKSLLLEGGALMRDRVTVVEGRTAESGTSVQPSRLFSLPFAEHEAYRTSIASAQRNVREALLAYIE